MVNDVRPPRIRPPPGSYRLTDVNNLGIIVKSNVATVENLFTSRRNRLFTSSESAEVADQQPEGEGEQG